MEKSLIKPNQCQKFGIQICNDPTDPNRNIGIEESEDLFISMTMERSTCGIVKHPPTNDELHGCQKMIISDEFYWDTLNNLFENFSMEEEYRTGSNFYRYINIVESRVPCALPTIQCIDNSGIHEFDRAMENFYIVISQDLMVSILIRKVRVK